MRQLMNQAHLMVLAAHDLNSVSQICSKVAWMEHGSIVRIGPTKDVIAEYEASVHRAPPTPGALAA